MDAVAVGPRPRAACRLRSPIATYHRRGLEDEGRAGRAQKRDMLGKNAGLGPGIYCLPGQSGLGQRKNMTED